MNWDQIIKKASPRIVRIETPNGHGTGFLFLYSIFFLLLLSSLSLAEESRGVPEKLFGIKLGGLYDIGDLKSKDIGNLPIKKITGEQRFLGRGIHYYIQPKEVYKEFEYVEKREKPEDQYFRTSFRLYLLPVIPATATTMKQLENTKVNWEVTDIEWSNDAKTEEDAYFWAFNLCKTFKADILVEPKIKDYFENKFYECTFSSGDRDFKVSSAYSRTVSLSYKQEVFETKNGRVDQIIRKLEAGEIRPY